jgi:choline kinase
MKKNSVIILNALPDKKIKSLGNRCLVQIKKNKNILDHHIDSIKTIFRNPQIILVCGFDSKKVKKYVDTTYKNILYVEHDINDLTNIGQSLQYALEKISGSNCLVLNANNLLHAGALEKIRHSLDHTFVLTGSTNGDIGFISDNGIVQNCYYDLPNQIYDVLYIEENQLDIIKNIKNISQLYLFEIINKCIDNGMSIKPLKINSKSITVINSSKNIERLKNNYV